jgi:hypothetical protein
MAASRWESLVWPRWLPETARLPLVAQVTGAVALTALVMGPWWSRVTTAVPDTKRAAASAPAAASSTPPATVERPAHLNLDVRHSFASVGVLVTVDGKLALDTKLEGSKRKFKVFGKRAERGFTRTIDMQPGVRVVRVRIHSTDDRFDQARVERFDLASASVATLRISADKSTGMVMRADRPPASPQSPAAQPAALPPAAAAAAATAGPPPSIAQQANALAALLNSLRSMLIAIAGFVASAATGFVVQEFLRSKKRVIFARGEGGETDEAQRRRLHSHVGPEVE